MMHQFADRTARDRSVRSRLAPLLAAGALLLLGGCATGSFLGLATFDYVEEQLGATRDEITGARAQVDAVLVDVASVEEITTELESMLDTIRETERATSELQQLATVVASRLEALPTETLRRLVEILSTHLESTDS